MRRTYFPAEDILDDEDALELYRVLVEEQNIVMEKNKIPHHNRDEDIAAV